MVNYASLARTPSGALTAASKRLLEAERAEERRIADERYAAMRNARQAFANLETATHEFEQALGVSGAEGASGWLTEREEAISEKSHAQGVKEGRMDAEDDAESDLLGELFDAQRRLALGLDSELSVIEMLDRIENNIREIRNERRVNA